MLLILKSAIWHANGLWRHSQEIITFLQLYNIDIMLISETYLTGKSHVKILKYIIYETKRPDKKAYCRTAVINKQNFKSYEREKYQCEHMKATSIIIEEQPAPSTATI